jgi:hypothetical protein
MILVIVIGGTVFIVWKFIPAQGPAPTPQRQVLVQIIDSVTEKPISANFTILSNGTFVGRETSREDSFITVRIPETIGVVQIFFQHPLYYSQLFDVASNTITPKVIPIGTLSSTNIGELNESQGTVLLSIKAIGEVRDINICTTWSTNIIAVESTQYSSLLPIRTKIDCEYYGYIWVDRISRCGFWCKMGLGKENIEGAHCSSTELEPLPPRRLMGKAQKCFLTQYTVTEGNPLTLSLNYRGYETIGERDFVKVWVIDSDRDIRGRSIFEDEEGKDVGADDYVFEV